MGYTHYWTQPKDYSKADWQIICRDIALILDEARKHQVRLANGFGEVGTEPLIDESTISFNGVDEQGCETFYLARKRAPLEPWQRRGMKGGAFCKTRREPYDVAVTAALVYLAKGWNFSVSSDGETSDWVAGLGLVCKALPAYDGVFSIPIHQDGSSVSA